MTTQASSSITWSSQPSWKSGSVNNDYAVGHEDVCNASYVQKWDLTSQIKTALDSGTKIGIGMKSSDEGDKNGWRHYKQVKGTSTTGADGSVTSTWYPRIVIDCRGKATARPYPRPPAREPAKPPQGSLGTQDQSPTRSEPAHTRSKHVRHAVRFRDQLDVRWALL